MVLHDAFDAMERQVRELVQRRHPRAKAHEAKAHEAKAHEEKVNEEFGEV